MKRECKYILALLLCACCLAALLPARAAETGFEDVPASAWYAESLARILQEAPGTIGGMGNNRFEPEGKTTRAQFMKMLCAFSGEAAAPDFEERYGGESSYTDVSGWSSPYIQWASEQGLAEGTGAGKFSPGNPVTREQLAALLYRYAGQWEGLALQSSQNALNTFLDGWRVSSWAEEPMKWAVSNQILSGFDAHTLGPGKSATRAQVVTMLCNYLDFRESGGELPPDVPSRPGFEPKFKQVNGVRVVDAPYIDQRIKYPTGCESVSAVMALQYFGVDITPEIFIDGYLPKGRAPHYDLFGRYVGCDPRKAFPGNPYSSSGWGCYSPVIESSVKRVLQDRAGELPLSVKRTSGDSLDTLCREYTDNGVPVILWATIGMEAPQRSDSFLIEGTGEYFTWIYPMHCLLLTGRDDTGYFFNDPLKGKTVRYSKYAVERAYQGLGRQAVVMLPWQ